MPDEAFDRLEALVEAQTIELHERLKAPDQRGLGALTDYHASFMRELLPRLEAAVEKPELVRDLRRELSSFTHELVLRAKAQSESK